MKLLGEGAGGRCDVRAECATGRKAALPPTGSQGGTHSAREQVRIQKHIINRHKREKLVNRVCPWIFIRFPGPYAKRIHRAGRGGRRGRKRRRSRLHPCSRKACHPTCQPQSWTDSNACIARFRTLI